MNWGAVAFLATIFLRAFSLFAAPLQAENPPISLRFCVITSFGWQVEFCEIWDLFLARCKTSSYGCSATRKMHVAKSAHVEKTQHLLCGKPTT